MHPSKVTLRPKVRRPMAWDSTKSAPSAQQPRAIDAMPHPRWVSEDRADEWQCRSLNAVCSGARAVTTISTQRTLDCSGVAAVRPARGQDEQGEFIVEQIGGMKPFFAKGDGKGLIRRISGR